MERRQVLLGISVTVAGFGGIASASSAASPSRLESSSVVVGVTDDDISPTKEIYYDTDKLPKSHIDGYLRQDFDILAVTDVRDLDCDWMMTVHICPKSKNGQRLNSVWGAEMEDGGIVQSEENSRLLALDDVPKSIELTDVGVRVKYDV